MGVLSRQYYSQLEREAELSKQLSNYSFQNSLASKFMKKIGITNPLVLLGLTLAGLNNNISGKLSDITHLNQNTIELALLSPMLINKIGRLASQTAPRASVEYANLQQNNFRDYSVGTILRHASRAAYTGTTALGMGLMGAGYLSGNAGLLNAGMHLNPFSILFKGGNALGSALGAGLSHLTGISGLSSIMSILTPALLSMKLMPKLIGTIANPKPKNSKINIPAIQLGKISDLLMRSTYKNHMNSIIMMQNLNVLKPGEALIASILNDINLNTSALLPIYEKYFSNIKEVNNAQTANNLYDMFNNENEKIFDTSFTRKDYKKRKAIFHTLTSLELGSVDLLYKTLGNFIMKGITGKSYEDFQEEKNQYKLLINDGRLHALKAQAKRLNITPSGITALTKSASDFLQAPDYESRMLGLVSGIFELTKIIAKKSLGKEGMNLDKTLEKYNNIYQNSRDYLNNNFLTDNLGIIGRVLSSIYSISAKPLLYKMKNKLLSPFSTVAQYENQKSLFDLYKENFVDLKENIFTNPFKKLRDLILEGYGVVNDKKIIKETYNKEKLKLTKKFDREKAAFEYLGAHFPDDVTMIIKELKQQTTYFEDLLSCQNCQKTKNQWARDKWRGAFGSFMNETSFLNKLAKESFRSTLEILGIEKKTFGRGFFSNLSPFNFFAKKILKLKDKDLNQDQSYLDSLYKNDLNKVFNENLNNSEKTKSEAKVFSPISQKLKTLANSVLNFNTREKQEKEYNVFFEQLKIQKKIFEQAQEINDKFSCYLNVKGIVCKGALGIANFIKSKKEENEDVDSLAVGAAGGIIGWLGGKMKGLFKKVFGFLGKHSKKLALGALKIFKGRFGALASLALSILPFADKFLGSIKNMFVALKNKVISWIPWLHHEKAISEVKKPLTTKTPKGLEVKAPNEVKKLKEPEKLIHETKNINIDKITSIERKEKAKLAEKILDSRKEGIIKRFLRIATEKLLLKFDAAFVEKLMLKISSMVAGIFAGPIGWIWDVINALSLGWTVFEVFQILWDAWNEANNQDSNSIAKTGEKIVNKTIQEHKGGNLNPRDRRIHHERIISKTPEAGSENSVNRKNASSETPLKTFEEIKEILIETAKTQSTLLAQLNKLLASNVQINQNIANLLATQKIKNVSIDVS